MKFFKSKSFDFFHSQILGFPFEQFLLILIGIILRARHYLENRSFWLDEIYAAINITHRSFSDILSNIEIFPHFAKQPLVFTLISKSFVSLLGNNEFALRLLPFLSGIGALILFAVFLNRYFSRNIAFFTLFFFVISDPLIYYAAEFKQYSVEVLVLIFLLKVFEDVLISKCGLKQWVLLVVGGSLAMWLSYSSLFVLAGLGLGSFIFQLLRKNWRFIRMISITGVFWVLNAAALYWVSLRHMIGKSSILRTWQGALAPDQIFSFATLLWVKAVFRDAVQYLLGIHCLAWAGLLLCLVGFIRLLRKRRQSAIMWGLIIAVTFFAGLLQKYPLRGRLLLFLFPIVSIFLAEGICGWVPRRPKRSRMVCVLIGLAVLIPQIILASEKFMQGREEYENRQMIAQFARNYKPGDLLFFNSSAHIAFWYYMKQEGFMDRLQTVHTTKEGKSVLVHRSWSLSPLLMKYGNKEAIGLRQGLDIYNRAGYYKSYVFLPGQDNLKFVGTADAIDFFHSPRMWVFLSTMGEDYQLKVTNVLLRSGQPIFSWKGKGVALYLFDFSP